MAVGFAFGYLVLLGQVHDGMAIKLLEFCSAR